MACPLARVVVVLVGLIVVAQCAPDERALIHGFTPEREVQP